MSSLEWIRNHYMEMFFTAESIKPFLKAYQAFSPWCDHPQVLTDGLHLVCPDIDKLHQFADTLGFRRDWFQDNKRYPHYDLTTFRARDRAVKAGAKPVLCSALFAAMDSVTKRQ